MMKNNQLIKYLQDNYPSLVNETDDGNLEVNFNKLKEELNDVNISEETYGLNWMGKSYARVLRDYPVTTLIEPDNKHNNLDENKDSNNVYIEGDNLEVLKHLKNAYSNKIKMIYIDPPYNTGSDGFVYNDSFNFKVEDFMQLANVDEDEAKKILDYTTSKRSSHSAWLTFMYPRLYIARELLKDDGVIFISIDDNEQAQLKLLCDEIFGEDNFVSNLVWKSRSSLQYSEKLISSQTENVMVYAKNINTCTENEAGNFRKIEKELDKLSYSNPDEDPKGPWTSSGIIRDDGRKKYTVVSPTGEKFTEAWLYTEENFKELEESGLIYWGVNGDSKPRKKNYLTDYDGRVSSNLLMDEFMFSESDKGTKKRKMFEIGTTESGGKDLKKLFSKKYFTYPKPVALLTYLVNLVKLDNSGIVLDFFSGSATTAQAVMELNAKDNGNIKYIMVQLPEEIDENSNKGTYDFCKKELKSKNPMIHDIAKERIKRAAKKIKEENKDKEYINDIDFGFKVYKTIEDKRTKLSDIKEFDVNQKLLFDTDNLEALLTTWMLYDGYDLNTKVENFSINKYNGYLVESTLYLMDKDFSTKDLKTLVEKLSDEQTPIINRIVVNESNFTNKMLAEINEQVFDKNIKEVNINVIKRV